MCCFGLHCVGLRFWHLPPLHHPAPARIRWAQLCVGSAGRPWPARFKGALSVPARTRSEAGGKSGDMVSGLPDLSAAPSLQPENMVVDRTRFAEVASRFPLPRGLKFSYGTAGFRADGSHLMSTVFRCGVLAALRSLCTRQVTGLVVTASHNPLPDNGIKLADPEGGMLVMEWEGYADALANAGDGECMLQVVDQIARSEGIRGGMNAGGRVLVARDTRPSGQALVAAAIQGVEAVAGCVAEDMGVLATPQLHWMVRTRNQGLDSSETAYFTQLMDGFRDLVELGNSGVADVVHVGPVVDGANGVGALKLADLQRYLTKISLEVRNSGMKGDGALNEGVGADFVQKEKAAPRGFGSPGDIGIRCASLDGDADRLVYFYLTSSPEGAPSMHILDGDKILTLFASFIKDELQKLCSEKSSGSGVFLLPGYGYAKLGVVQTAYANGASTRYLKQNVGVEVALTKTGVKHLHEKVAEYDVGIYFEANGHGTILFKDGLLEWLRTSGAVTQETEKHQAIQRLMAVSQVVNQAVGDAISGLLMVEAVLLHRNWSVQDWDKAYIDLPSRQTKVKVANRASIKTTDAETRVAFPSELQDAIDMEVARYRQGRAFVRPSGTEDIVRVYAEASEQQDADLLADRVAAFVHKLAGGVMPNIRDGFPVGCAGL